jgi:hypothetical protein
MTERTHKPAPQLPFRERLTCTVAEAVEATGLCRDVVYDRINSGALASRLVGKRRLISVASLVALVEGPQP